MPPSNQLASFATGVELIIGIPGAGKSYFATRRIVEDILKYQRPVFTNVPLRFLVVKAYLILKGGVEYRNLIYELKEDHFRAFIARVSRYQSERNAHRERCQDEHRRFNEAEFEANFLAAHGPHITTSHQAETLSKQTGIEVEPNWIPPTAQVWIDEVHHWFPAPRPGVARTVLEPPELMTYITMLRHHVHSLVVMSQDEMQFTITIRRMAKAVWRLIAVGDLPIVGDMCRLSTLGITGVRADRYHPGAEDSFDPDLMRPLERRTYLYNFPWNRWVFRLYDSFTHSGSPRRLRKILQAEREKAGLTGAGLLERQLEAAQKRAEQRRKDRLLRNRLRRWGKRLLYLSIICVTALVAHKCAPTPEPLAPTETVLEWTPITSHGKNYVRTKTTRYNLGDITPNGVLLRIDPRNRTCWFVRDDDWVYEYQHNTPLRVFYAPDRYNHLRSGLDQ